MVRCRRYLLRSENETFEFEVVHGHAITPVTEHAWRVVFIVLSCVTVIGMRLKTN